jgi:hypothetical protein
MVFVRQIISSPEVAIVLLMTLSALTLVVEPRVELFYRLLLIYLIVQIHVGLGVPELLLPLLQDRLVLRCPHPHN